MQRFVRGRSGRRRLVAVAAVVVAVVGCGGDDAASPPSSTAGSTTAPPSSGPTSSGPTSSAPTSSAPEGSPTRVVVDTDVALDDLVAMTFLLSSHDIDVRAITVSGTGEVRCPAGVGVVEALLARVGADDVQVACGRSTPLAGAHAFPTGWRDAADSGWGVLEPTAAPPTDGPSAVDLLADHLQPDVTLLTLGPLTNVADALRSHTGLADRIGSIIVMGGAVDVVGNVPGTGTEPTPAEWNVFVDPVAAAEVFGAGAPVLLVGLDATGQVPVTSLFLERLALNQHTGAARLVADLYSANSLVLTGDAYFWDPLAAAVILDPALATTEQVKLEVVTDEGSDVGRTRRSEQGFPVDVAIGADAAAFEELLLRTIDGLSPGDDLVEPPSPVGEAVVTYDGTDCRYDGPIAVSAGRLGVRFESADPTWFAAVLHLTDGVTVDDVVAWVEANPGDSGVPPGVEDVVPVAAGTVSYAGVRPPVAGLVCLSPDTGEVLVAGSIVVA